MVKYADNKVKKLYMGNIKVKAAYLGGGKGLLVREYRNLYL